MSNVDILPSNIKKQLIDIRSDIISQFDVSMGVEIIYALISYDGQDDTLYENPLKYFDTNMTITFPVIMSDKSDPLQLGAIVNTNINITFTHSFNPTPNHVPAIQYIISNYNVIYSMGKFRRNNSDVGG